MNPANLPFDSDAMLQGLRTWVECESPTWDASAVERMLDIAAREMAIMGASIERIAGRQGFGGCVRARFPHPKQGEPGILIAGHLDTVHPIGTLDETAVPARGQQMLRPRHLRHEGRQLPDAGSDPATGARRLHDAAADHGPVHAGRGSRHALGARPHRGGSRAQQIRAGAGARPSPTTASSPGATRSPVSISRRSASRAMPAPRCRPAARRSARWRARSSPSTA